jgi:hypothetical protein
MLYAPACPMGGDTEETEARYQGGRVGTAPGRRKGAGTGVRNSGRPRSRIMHAARLWNHKTTPRQRLAERELEKDDGGCRATGLGCVLGLTNGLHQREAPELESGTSSHA